VDEIAAISSVPTRRPLRRCCLIIKGDPAHDPDARGFADHFEFPRVPSDSFGSQLNHGPPAGTQELAEFLGGQGSVL
jgi:hypothetical protein